MALKKVTNKIALLTLVLANLIISCKKSDETVTKSERQVYEFITPSGTGFSNGCPTIVDNFIYIGTSSNFPNQSNFFYKLNLSLNKVWEYALGGEQILGPPSLDSNGNIYFITDSARLGHMSPSEKIKLWSLTNTGSLRWMKTISGLTIVQGMKCVAISQDDVIYAPGDSLRAFDINGDEIWSYGYWGEVYQAPILDPNGNIYFVSNNKFYSINKNGNLNWLYETGENGGCKSTCAFNVDYSAVIAPISTTLYSVSTASGNLNWKYVFTINADFRSTPAIDENNDIYVCSHGNGGENDESTIYKVKADGSGVIWENNVGGDMYSSPTLGSDNAVYVGSEGHNNTGDKHNRLHAFSMTDGSGIWSAQLENDVLWGSPILEANGILYVGTAHVDGKSPSGLFGFSTGNATLRSNCGSPTFQLSNAHNGRRY